jgi:hypothetical protein
MSMNDWWEAAGLRERAREALEKQLLAPRVDVTGRPLRPPLYDSGIGAGLVFKSATQAGPMKWRISDGSLDRDRDRVDPRRWILPPGGRVPVLLGHDRARIVGVAEPELGTDGAWYATVRFADTAPGAEARSLAALGALSASIGFRDAGGSRRNEQGGLDFGDIELQELSLVPVPANRNAVRVQ